MQYDNVMPPITFIELREFTRLVYEYLTEESYRELQAFLMEHPEAGEVIKSSDGCRKIRWAAKGHGKRGGARIIYIYRRANGEIWMLTIYSKNEQENISLEILRKLRRQIDA